MCLQKPISQIIMMWTILTYLLLSYSLVYAQSPTPLAKASQAIQDQFATGQAQEFLVVFDAEAIHTEALERRRGAGLLHDDANIVALKVAEYARLKQRVLSVMPPNVMTMLHDYSHLPIAFVRVPTLAALTQFLEQEGIVAVYENRDNVPFLTQSLPLINQPPVTVAGFGGGGATVAVLDSCVDYTRAAFGACTAPGVPAGCKVVFAQDFALEDGMRDDAVGHGTNNVAGIIVGVAPEARIAALDVFTGGAAADNHVLAAINWAIQNQAALHVVAMNLSLGGGRFFSECPASPYTTAFAVARAAGIVPVVASGNDNYKDSMAHPACVPGAVRVGAVYDANLGPRPWSSCFDLTTAPDQVTCFSNSAAFLTLLAPGALITAAGIEQGGTSQATPHVAGAIAALRASNAFPTESLDQTISRLLSTGTPLLDPLNGRTTPRLNLQAALELEPGPSIGAPREPGSY